ncbi:unnamed protein product [Triticum turgidum subsp. durum]|uniref:F-box domain-containing protein n=1 Tax=Triticum turgidum subsp. durum TaxID=4567 RepID=A0A9R1S921_TRITD|nr:unnamed protein product [Triticum turgidum subsp. durum]
MADPPAPDRCILIPDEIAIWEILVRLPPKSLIRCRAVCPAWRRATSTRDFLLAHHARQPTLPILCSLEDNDDDDASLYITPFDHRTSGKLQPLARLDAASDICLRLSASCGGLLVLSFRNMSSFGCQFSICNPATRQYAPLPLDYGPTVEYTIFGIYPHIPTGEYRLLLHRLHMLRCDGCYVFSLGSGQQLRYVGRPDLWKLTGSPRSVLFRGSLHWHSSGIMVMVFDTTSESFWRMRSPVFPGYADLYDIGDMLGLCSHDNEWTSVSIWALQDYEGEVWTLKYRVKLPVAEIWVHDKLDSDWDVVVGSWDGDVVLLVTVDGGNMLFQVDINGKLVATICCCRDLYSAHLWLKQTLVLHTFFPTLEGYAANALPFI